MEVYSRSHVTIDDNFARFGAKSYAINKITSVEVRKHEHRSNGWLVMIILGLLGGVVGLGVLGGTKPELGYGIIALAVLFFFLGVRAHSNRLAYSYELFLATAAGEVQATQSTDGDAIEELRQAIEARIIQHGSLRG